MTEITLVWSRLPLAEADLGAIQGEVEQEHPGYRLLAWDGLVADELMDTFVASRHAMDDMPGGGDPPTWDREAVRNAVARVEGRGEHLHTVAAATDDGEIVGFTELVVPADGTGDAQHYGTGVLPEHRGRGLGRWIKAAVIVRAHEAHPGLAGLLTDTVDTNLPMLRISDGLGYVRTHTTREQVPGS